MQKSFCKICTSKEFYLKGIILLGLIGKEVG